MTKVKNIPTASFLQNLSYHKHIIALVFILIVHLFFRLYQFEIRATFEWDQVDNAWATQRILIEKNYPLIGMQAKLNSGLYIGPLYYYAISLPYALTHYDPIASPIIATLTSVIGFFVLYLVTKSLFNRRIAFFALLINASSVLIIASERVQWPVNFISLLSLLIFYFIYKAIRENTTYLIFAAVAMGLFFHIHFTAIFFPIIILCILPFLPRTKKTIKIFGFSIIIILLFFTPIILYNQQTHQVAANNLTSYITMYSHGFHFRRFIQLAHDAFIEFVDILKIQLLRSLGFILLPLFAILSAKRTKNILMSYMTIIWFLVPWVIFTLYKGEISNYYFYANRDIAIIILASVSMWMWEQKSILIKIFLLIFWTAYGVVNIQEFFKPNPGNLEKSRERVNKAIRESRKIEFTQGVPDSYIYDVKTKFK